MKSAAWILAVVLAALPVAADGSGAGTTGSALLWVSKPDGCVQCTPCTAPSLVEVIAALAAAGIPVRRSRERHVPVCDACVVCPTGRVWAVQAPGHRAAALARAGWTLLREPQGGWEVQQ